MNDSSFISLPDARRKIELLYPALSVSVLPKAVAELGLTIETREIKVLSIEDFTKLQDYLKSFEVRKRLHRETERRQYSDPET